MKLRMICAYVAAMVLVSTVSLGSIESTGTGTTASASASASNGTNYDEDSESNWKYVYTTQGGTFEWYVEAYARAWAKVVIGNGWASADGVGSGSASCSHGSVSAYASASLSSTGDISDVDDPPTKNGTNGFDPYQGVSGDCDALAVAEIEEGSSSSAAATGYAIGYPGLFEH